MNNKEILNNKPIEDWTHHTNDGLYLLSDDDGFFFWNEVSGAWNTCIGYKLIDVRARADIERIVELERPSEWVSVEDRLPQADTTVICFTSCDNIIVGGHLEGSMYSGNRYVAWDLQENHDVLITHWMPLPKPPKQGS